MIDNYKPLLRNRNFMYLWFSQILSQITTQLCIFLLLFKLFEITGSSIAVSLLWVSYALPAILIGPFASVSVDMLDRKNVLVITNLLQSIIIFSYALSYKTSLFLLYGAVIAYSLLNQFNDPAEMASVTFLVKKKFLPQANSLFLITSQTSLVLGVMMASLMGKLVGFSSSLKVCSALLFLAFLSAAFLPRIRTLAKIPKDFEKAFFNFFQQMVYGYKFIRQKKEILYPFLLLLFIQVVLAVITVNVPVIVKKFFLLSSENTSVLIIPIAIGTVSGAIQIPKELDSGERKIKLIKRSLFLITLSFILLLFLIPQLAKTYKLIYALITNLVLGYSFVSIVIPAQTLIQEKTPGDLRGRVFGNYGFIITIATIFPVLLSGTIVEIFGIKTLIFLLGIFFFSILFFIEKKGDSLINEAAISNNA